jgi:hypothetical protein
MSVTRKDNLSKTKSDQLDTRLDNKNNRNISTTDDVDICIFRHLKRGCLEHYEKIKSSKYSEKRLKIILVRCSEIRQPLKISEHVLILENKKYFTFGNKSSQSRKLYKRQEFILRQNKIFTESFSLD